MLSSRAVKIFKDIKPEFDRPEWKFRRVSCAQSSYLVRHIELSDLISIDRGTASLLMDCIFKLSDKDKEITDANVLGELYKIANRD